MNILVVSPSDRLGGAEQFLLNIAKEYIKRGYTVHVFFLLEKSNSHWSDVDGMVTYYTASKREIFGLFSFVLNYIRYRNRYDLTFSSHQHINSLLSVLRSFKLLRSSKLIVRESTSVYIRYKRPKLFFYHFFYFFYIKKSIDLIICQTDNMKNQLIEGFRKFLQFNIQVIDNPIDLSVIAKKSIGEVDVSGPYIISIGRLHKVKGFDNLIKAFKKADACKSHKLIILGEGAEYSNLRALIVELMLEDKVFLLGHVENIYPFVKGASLGVISSSFEGFPNVLLQMYSMNLKVVTTNCCGGLNAFPNLFIVYNNTIEDLSMQIDKALNCTMKLDFSDFISNYDIKQFPEKLNKLF